MATSMKFRAITANCGNDGIGVTASEKIAESVKGLDFVVINCQEVNFEVAKKQLEEQLGKDSGYSVTLLSQMVTYTKVDEQQVRKGNTGIASYIIHRNDLKVIGTEPITARRSEESGTAFNKGGLVTNFTIIDPADKDNPIRLQTVSGHLDSSKIAERTQDWANINKAISKDKVNNWGDLAEAMPNIRLAGYDANTRNQFVKGGEPIKSWELENGPQELKGLQQAPLGGVHFSRDSTYKTSKKNITTVEDLPNRFNPFKKGRPGYTRGGMLDFVDVAMDDNSISKPKPTTEQVENVGSGEKIDPSTGRDHDVIISPEQTYNQSPEITQFDRVKNQMAIQLSVCAPKLANEIRAYTEKDKDKLVENYNDYLSKDGFLNKQLGLQAETLGCIKRINKIDKKLGGEIEQAMLGHEPWLNSTPAEIVTKQNFQKSVVEVLKSCKTKTDLETVQEAIKTPETFNKATQDIKDRANTRFLTLTALTQQVYDLVEKITSSSAKSASPRTRADSITNHLDEFCESAKKIGITSITEALINAAQSAKAKISSLFVKEPSSNAIVHRALDIIVKQLVSQVSVGIPSVIIAKDKVDAPARPVMKSLKDTKEVDFNTVMAERRAENKNVEPADEYSAPSLRSK